MTSLKPGLNAELLHVVTEQELATSWKNDLPVLATPILLWLSELACMKAIEDVVQLPLMTVGLEHNSRHEAPTPKNFVIRIKAKLLEFDGKILKFRVEAHDGFERIFIGTHYRCIVHKEKFQVKIENKIMKRSTVS